MKNEPKKLEELIPISPSSHQLQQALNGEHANGTELSIYRGELTPKLVAMELKKLEIAFPALNQHFFNLLAERLVANGFTDKRLKDAIGYVIDNFSYKTPNIANIVSFDKRIKLYDWNDVYNFDQFSKIKRKGKLFWIKTTDKEQFGIGDEL